METPTATQIRDMVKEAESYWSVYHQQAAADFLLVTEGPQVIVKSAKGETLAELNPPTAKTKTDAAANHLIANFPTITVDKRAFPEGQQDVADTLEAALQAIFWRATEGEAQDPHRGSTQNAAQMGMGVIQIAVDFSDQPVDPGPKADPEDKREYEWQKKQFFPLAYLPVDPREILPDPGKHGERWLARKTRMTVGEIRSTFEGWTPPNGAKIYHEFDECDVLEWWSKDSYYFECDGHPVERVDPLADHEDESAEEEAEDTEPTPPTPSEGPWRNPLGFIPYVVFPSGYGTASGKPENRYMSLITAARKGNLFKSEARRMGQLDAIIGKMAWGALIGPPGMAEIDLSPGTYNEVVPDANGNIPEPKVVGFINPPTGIFAELARVQDAIDQNTLPAVLDSAESGSAESALKFVRKTQEALVNLNPLQKNLQRAWVKVFTRTLSFFDNPNYFGPSDTVYIYGQSNKGPVQAEIGPKMLKGRHVPVFVEIRPALPEDETLRIQTGAAILGRGLGLEDFYDRFMRVDDPQAMAKRFYKSQIQQQIIETGLIAQYASAVMSGQANPLAGLQGFLAGQNIQQGPYVKLGPKDARTAVERTPENQQQQTPGAATAASGNPGLVDLQAALQRQLLNRSAVKPRA